MSLQIDWEQQWRDHAFGFQNGLAHIPLPNGEEILLKPGPGFGDFSHPTTQLMITMMHTQVKNKQVFDIGSGSGILSCGAIKLGASTISWVDCSPEAELHTCENAHLNKILKTPLRQPEVLLMNMIFSEQKCAWNTYGLPFQTLITSGILISERDQYLDYAKSQHWQLLNQWISGEWAGFIFKEMQ